jgi:predicted dehydrogenase
MPKRKLNIALIGYQFMGKAHSNAYRQVARFFDLPVEPVMKVICGINGDRVEAAAGQLGWEEYSTEWTEVVERPDVDMVDISAPGHLHAPIAIAAAKAGKIVFCEKPLANSLAEAKAMLQAVKEAGVAHGLSHNYRKVPAIALAKQIIADGKLGKLYHFRATYLQDWIMDPEFPLVWRLQKEYAGSGAHGDLNAHIIDLGRFLVGEIDEVSGQMATFIKERPLLEETSGGLSAAGGRGRGEVTVDDATQFLAQFENGALGTFEATRFAQGRRNYNRFEINGAKGSLVFNLERMNELELYLADDPAGLQGFRTIQTTEAVHPYVEAWWPAGHIIGYEHTFINQLRDAFTAIGEGKPLSPNFEDGVKNQAVLEAVEISANEKRWVSPKSLL